jgi:hypothetical protein
MQSVIPPQRKKTWSARIAAAPWCSFAQRIKRWVAAVVGTVGRVLINPKHKRGKPVQHSYAVVIEGVSPLIQNNPTAMLDKKDGLRNTEKVSKSHQDPTEQWRSCVYREEGGKKLLHPSAAMELALAEASKNFKAKGRGSMNKALKASCFIDGEYMTISNREEPDEVKRMTPRNSMGQIVQYYAPVFSPGWRMEFQLDLLDDEIITPPHLKAILDFAGARIGIGVHRPKYGRFMVVKFEEIDASSKRAA